VALFSGFGMVLRTVQYPSRPDHAKTNAMTKLHATNFGISLLLILAFFAFILIVSGLPL
jgi:hypothetical protein